MHQPAIEPCATPNPANIGRSQRLEPEVPVPAIGPGAPRIPQPMLGQVAEAAFMIDRISERPVASKKEWSCRRPLFIQSRLEPNCDVEIGAVNWDFVRKRPTSVKKALQIDN
jgi:hypothetical protein